jgi:hypothetical protein
MEALTDIYRLFYVSSAAPQFISGIEIDRILEVSQKRNSQLGLTGALYFDGANFAQVLEGPLPALEQTYERISRDMRHQDLKVLEMSMAARRHFSDWAMAQVKPTDLTKLMRLDLNNLPAAGVLIAGMLTTLFDTEPA